MIDNLSVVLCGIQLSHTIFIVEPVKTHSVNSECSNCLLVDELIVSIYFTVKMYVLGFPFLPC